MIPDLPHIDHNQWIICKNNSDFRPITFEWYKFIGQLSASIANIKFHSPVIKIINNVNYSIMIGLLNRCSRLMLSNIALSHKGKFGETTAIIDRCIFESAIKLRWLIKKDNEKAFKFFLAKGLITEVVLKEKIQSNIDNREGKILPIENRMIDSANKHIRLSGLDEQEIKANNNKLPNLSSMIDELEESEFLYIAGQRIGSHHVHGNWPSLLFHYLEEDEEQGLKPRGHNCEPQIDLYLFISFIIIMTLEQYTTYIIRSEHTKGFLLTLSSVRGELIKIYEEIVEDDFK